MALIHKWKLSGNSNDYVGSANSTADTSTDAPGIYSGRSRKYAKASSQKTTINPNESNMTSFSVIGLVRYTTVPSSGAYTIFGAQAWAVGKFIFQHIVAAWSPAINSLRLQEYTQSISETRTYQNYTIVPGKKYLFMGQISVASKTSYGYIDCIQRYKSIGANMSNISLVNYFIGSDFQNSYMNGSIQEMEIYNEVKSLSFMKTKEAYYKGVF